MTLSEIVQRGWDAVGAGDFDALVAGTSRLRHCGIAPH
jgi:hypothetical protein